MKQKITEISNNHELTWEERQKQVDTLLDNIPPEELAKMPLPPGLESLPAGVYDQIEVGLIEYKRKALYSANPRR